MYILLLFAFSGELSHWQRCMRSTHGHHLVHTYSSMWLHTILCCVKMILYDMHIRSNLAWLLLQLLKKSAHFGPAAEPRKQLFIYSVQERPNVHNSLRSNTAQTDFGLRCVFSCSVVTLKSHFHQGYEMNLVHHVDKNVSFRTSQW